MSVVAAVAVGHVLSTTRSVERGYRLLIEGKAESALLIDDVLLDISESAQLVHAMLASRQESARSGYRADLVSLQAQINEKMVRLRERSPDKRAAIDSAQRHATAVMTLAQDIAQAGATALAEQASQLLQAAFEPELAKLKRALEVLLNEITQELDGASTHLSSTTTLAAHMAVAAAGVGLSVGVLLAVYFARQRVSLPMLELTQVIGQVSQGNYDQPIGGIYRRDEIGTIATALLVFRENWQRTERLSREAAEGEETRRLSEQLTEVTNGIPGVVFQCHIAADGRCDLRLLSKRRSDRSPASPSPTHAMELFVSDSLATMLDNPDSPARAHLDRCAATMEAVSFDTAVEREGKPCWFRTMATARPAQEGGTLYNGAAFDVTEIKNQARALMLAKQAAEKTTREKSDLLSVMSHEIRTPLNAILGMAQLAAKDTLDTQQRGQVEQILRSGQHLQGVIDDILDFSRIESGHLSLDVCDFSIDQVLNDVLQMCQHKARDKGLVLRVHRDPAIPVRLRGDPLRVSQVLINYINNALKFTPRGTVDVQACLAQHLDDGILLHLTVQDTGIGMTPDQMATLFQPFKQADASISRRFGGSGLGLAISRRLAELMGGEAGVQSELGAGSSFWFTVRVQCIDTPLEQPPAAQAPSAKGQDLHGLRVLVVEDNALNQLVIRGLLEACGMRVDTADNGKIALDTMIAAPDGTYAAVLMDLQMPVMDGVTATRKLRELPRFSFLPIIAVTASVTRDDIESARQAGIDDYVAKPISEAALRSALQHWIFSEGEARLAAHAASPQGA